ncbi:plant cysteine oxidase 1-like, partial [Durio zibethinus]|uniref:cysteine dioxygenase n=1 Tax=Durio zibethinus TaxID=66656 RepID=A0A6P6AM88_DURZI
NADIFEAVDVGIDEFSLDGSPSSSSKITNGLIPGQGVSEITYIHVYECDNFSIGIFCFPAGRTFPLHDHPGMTVLSKLLYGSVYIKAYDWVREENSSHRTSTDFSLKDILILYYRSLNSLLLVRGADGVAGTVIDGIFNAPCEPSVLFPRSGGNIHSFTALTPCAILDVLSPPYSDDFGRPSTYFLDFPIPSLPGNHQFNYNISLLD